MKLNALDYTALVLIIVGGLNWGLVGVFNYNLVDSLFGVQSIISTTVYILVGISALYAAVSLAMKAGKKV